MSNLDRHYACIYCGTVKCSLSGTGSDISCCGEVGHVEEVTADGDPLEEDHRLDDPRHGQAELINRRIQ
jgi:hypothetical protein